MKKKLSTAAREETEVLSQRLRSLVDSFSDHGFTVRRENLTRGSSFRVKSGSCLLAEKKLLFVDKRMSLSQQVSVLTDFAGELALDAK